jgi:hypothetical protein
LEREDSNSFLLPHPFPQPKRGKLFSFPYNRK